MKAVVSVACVHLPALPLQVLLHDRPSWRGAPLALVDEDRPDAPLVRLDARARQLGLRTGMRLGAARNVVPGLRAAVVGPERIAAVVDELARALSTFSPRVEVADGPPGTFLLDPSGLDRLYGGARTWAATVRGYLTGRGLRCSLVVGQARARVVCIARSRTGVLVVRDAKHEQELVAAVPLDRLNDGKPPGKPPGKDSHEGNGDAVANGLSARARDALAMLGVRTVGDLLELPAGELASRLGPEVARVHAELSDDPQLPMRPQVFEEPVRVTLEVDPPDADHARLLFAIKGGLHEMMRTLAGRHELLSALRVHFELERRTRPLQRPQLSSTRAHPEQISLDMRLDPVESRGEEADYETRLEPAEATRDAMLVVELVRLRLADVRLAAPVTAIRLTAESVPATGQQLLLPTERPRRDVAAGARALGRLRAAYGPCAVTRATLRDAHLPEARFGWEPIKGLRPATTAAAREAEEGAPPLVRRVLARPRPLPARDPSHPESGPGLARDEGAILRLYGPYRVSGGWWVRKIERDYYYAETGRGSLLWLYFDRPRKRWFLQGMVD